MENRIDLDVLEAALAKATPGTWSVEMDGPTDDDSPCDVIIPEINRILHSTEWADPEDFEQDVANTESIVAAHNALPALIAELRELRAREAHMRRFAESMAEDGHPILMGFAYQVQAILGTHALPLPPAPEAQ